ncbi:AMP-binding protein, partial [Thermodesulfobacteriota bacterium]
RPALVNPERIIEAIENLGVTNMFASPALLNRVGSYGKKKGVKLPSLKRVISAGAPVSAANIEQFSALLAADAEIHTPYGATEAVPIVSIKSKEILNETRQLSDKAFGTCIGRPINDIDIRIIKISDEPIDEWSDDLRVSPGDVGEITVTGDLVSRQYFNNHAANRLGKIKEGDAIIHRMGDVGIRSGVGLSDLFQCAAVKVIGSLPPAEPCLPFPVNPCSTKIHGCSAVRWWGLARQVGKSRLFVLNCIRPTMAKTGVIWKKNCLELPRAMN